MTEQQQQAKEAPDDAEQPEADLDESDHADGADIFEAVDPADLDADLDEDTDAADGDDDQGDEQQESEASAQQPDPAAVASGEVSLGHVYCRGLGVATSVAVQRCNEDDPRDRVEIIEEYAGLAKQMEIDQYIDQHVEQSGSIEQMSPGKAAVLMTGALLVMVAVSEPALADSALDGLGGIDLPTDAVNF